jgi:RNA polymerase sigma-70 factor (ECF subfamily)
MVIVMSSAPSARGQGYEKLSLHEKILTKDVKALEELIGKYSERVQVWIYRYIEGFGDIKDAEELAADVFFKIWEEIDKFNPSRASFSTWVYRKARSVALDYRRKIIWRQQIRNRFLGSIYFECEEERERATSTRTLDEPEQIILLQKVQNAIGRLPEEKQRLMQMRFEEGKTYAEIAELMDKPIGSVKSSLNRVLGYLKQITTDQIGVNG